ncbi:Uncharacterised protein [Mycobacteroides abscessus subsp. abscessus]|nr:Uncharacterised protein [Mycobacteroides abscessus subsp. abscessus]
MNHPVSQCYEDSSANGISNGNRYKVCSIISPCEAPCKDGCRNDKHIGYNVLEADGNKCHDREPDRKNLTADIISSESKPDA